MYFWGAAPAALTFLSVALSLQKVGHPWSKGFELVVVAVLKHKFATFVGSFENHTIIGFELFQCAFLSLC